MWQRDRGTKYYRNYDSKLYTSATKVPVSVDKEGYKEYKLSLKFSNSYRLTIQKKQNVYVIISKCFTSL